MPEIPIACTLGPAQMSDRVRVIDQLVSDALVDQQPIDGGRRVTFRADPGVEERISELVAAESRCCAFLMFDVGRGHDGALRLDITGPPDARPIIDQHVQIDRDRFTFVD